jgi:hypothetical protein
MFRNTSEQISLADIAQIESALKVQMPQTLKDHYLKSNGGVPDPNYWLRGDNDPLCVHRFIPMKYPAGNLTIESVYKRGIEKDFLPPDLIPFAVDEGSNFFCVDAQGTVWFYAMDAWSSKLSTAENKIKAKKFVADSLEKFVSGLTVEPDDM